MAVPKLEFYSGDGLTANPSLSFSSQNGSPTAAQVIRLYNDKGGLTSADDAEGVAVEALSALSGSTNFSADDFYAANRFVEVRAVGQGGVGIEAQTTAWTRVGKNARLSLRKIPGDCYRELEVRLNIPAGSGSVARDVLLISDHSSTSRSIGEGHYEGAQGVLAGVGDSDFSAILSGGVLTPNSPADNEVNLSLSVGVVAGVPFAMAEQAIVFNDEDGSSVALASGESYPVIVSFGSDGAGGVEVHATKGDKATAPLDPDDRPELPDGDVLIGFVEVPFSAEIDSTEIDQQELLLGGFALDSTASSLTVQVHGGHGMVNNHIVRSLKKTPLTLPASDDSYLWVGQGATYYQTTDLEAPVPRAALLWKVTTDGTGVTAVVDLRTWIAPNLYALPISRGGVLADEGKAYSVIPAGGPSYLLPLGSVLFSLGDAGGTSGATGFDLEASEAGGAWASILLSIPTIAYTAIDPRVDGQPTVFRLEGGTRLRVRVDEVPADASEDLTAILWLARP